MGTDLSYTPRQVTQALQALARDNGDVEATAEKLIDDEFMVTAAVLYEWKTETHAEQYSRIVEALGAELERNAIIQLQRIVGRANDLKLGMMERVGEITRPELVSQALRALSDVGAKSTNQLMQLTGRPVAGNAGDASVEAITRIVTGLQAAGLIKIAPSVVATLGPGDVEEVRDSDVSGRT